MAQFLLHSPYSPAGDQPQAIEKIVDSIINGARYSTLVGVTGSGKTYTMANIIAKLNLPTLIMTHNKTLAAQLYSEFKGFFPKNKVEYFISHFDYYQPEAYIPRRDLFIEKDSVGISVQFLLSLMLHQSFSGLYIVLWHQYVNSLGIKISGISLRNCKFFCCFSVSINISPKKHFQHNLFDYQRFQQHQSEHLLLIFYLS